MQIKNYQVIFTCQFCVNLSRARYIFKKECELKDASTVLACGQDCDAFSLLVMMQQSPDHSGKCHLRPVVLSATGKHAEDFMRSKTASNTPPLNQFLPPGSGLALPPSLPLMGDRHTSLTKAPSPNLSLNSSTNYEPSFQICEQMGPFSFKPPYGDYHRNRNPQ